MEIIQSGPQSKSEGNILNAKGIQRTNRNTEVQQRQTPMSTTCTSKVVNCREVLKKKEKNNAIFNRKKHRVNTFSLKYHNAIHNSC